MGIMENTVISWLSFTIPVIFENEQSRQAQYGLLFVYGHLRKWYFPLIFCADFDTPTLNSSS